jgi:hypothetical protein
MRRARQRLKDLNFYIFNTKNPQSEHVLKVERAYEFWHRSWISTFSNLQVDHDLRSDDFLDREVMALFDEDRPVALFFDSWFTIRNSHLNHSYFKNYPKEVIEKMNSLKFKKFMTLSYMTCDFDFRKSFTDVPMAELLFSLAVLRFQKSTYEHLVGYIRKDLSFHKAFARHGGNLLYTSKAYNVEVDFLYFDQKSCRLSPLPGVADTAYHLWEKFSSNTQTIKAA